MTSNIARLEEIVGRLPEASRVDMEEWGGTATFRVRGKIFVLASPDTATISVKLSKEEAFAMVATDPQVTPTGYGLGRHGWVTVTLGRRPSSARWQEVEECVRTSYSLIAPKKLSRQVLEIDQSA